MPSSLHPEIRKLLVFLRKHPGVRARIPAPANKTVVYSGDIKSPDGVFAAWKVLAQAKAQDPRRFDYVTLEERLRTLHVPEFGETLFEQAIRISDQLKKESVSEREMLIHWRALSGIYVQGAVGKVRALILPGERIGNSVFSLTEVKVLLKRSVLANIDIDEALLREFRLTAKTGLKQSPIIVF